MAMAAVRPLKAKDQASGPVAVPRLPSLAERLGDALRAAEVPDRRVGELTSSLADALAREDYVAAAAYREDLTGAREEAALANAMVTALQDGLAEIERQATEDGRQAQLQQQRDEAQHRLNESWEAERGLLGDLDAEVDAVWAALETVRRTYQNALDLETRIGHLRTGQHQARVTLGQAESGQWVNAPNKASVLQDSYPVIREIAAWSR